MSRIASTICLMLSVLVMSACGSETSTVPMERPDSDEMRNLTNFSDILSWDQGDQLGLFVAARQGVFFAEWTPEGLGELRYVTLGWRDPVALTSAAGELFVGLASGELFRVKNPLGESAVEPLGTTSERLTSILARKDEDEVVIYVGADDGLHRWTASGTWDQPLSSEEAPTLEEGVVWLFEDPHLPDRFFVQTGAWPSFDLYVVSEDGTVETANRNIRDYHSMYVHKQGAHVFAPTAADKQFHITAILLVANLNRQRQQQIASIAISESDPSLLYVGVDCCGTRKITRQKFKWEATQLGPPGKSLRSLVIHPNDAEQLVGGTSRALVESLDGGQSWSTAYESEAAQGRPLSPNMGIGLQPQSSGMGMKPPGT